MVGASSSHASSKATAVGNFTAQTQTEVMFSGSRDCLISILLTCRPTDRLSVLTWRPILCGRLVRTEAILILFLLGSSLCSAGLGVSMEGFIFLAHGTVTDLTCGRS